MRMLNKMKNLEQLLQTEQLKHNLSPSQLVQEALMREEAVLTEQGALRALTGKYTGRSPMDKFIAEDEISSSLVNWGKINQPISEALFDNLSEKVISYLSSRETIYSFQGYAGADTRYHLPIQVINEFAWHNLFAHQLFVRPSSAQLDSHAAGFTLLCAPGLKADPSTDGTNSEAFIIISFKKRMILIGGTEYAGEMKKSIFSVMNFLLPQKEVLPMHCSANVDEKGKSALFFGLSGTGKTTLSANSARPLVGDDEHGWSPDGIFNIEGGCYAKCIDLSKEKEPEIYNAIKFGTILENVAIDEQGICQYQDSTVTENSRAAYPLDYIPNSVKESAAGHPSAIIFLTADATGVLPPISKLTKEQAMYHFLSGYTSKLAGTERGITEPQATFSACFGEPFLPLPPRVYADMLGSRIEQYNVPVYLVNTGWAGGDYHTGSRINLRYTRSMVEAAVSGDLQDTETVQDKIFGLHIPISCPGVPASLLMPETAWTDKHAYHTHAIKLAKAFQQNFNKFSEINETIKKAGPLSQ